MKTIKGKMLSIYALVFLALASTVIGAFVAVDTQEQHLVLTELLSKQKLLVERVTFTAINAGENALSNKERYLTTLDQNMFVFEDNSGKVDFMLKAFTDKSYPLDGKIVKLKFRNEFLKIFDQALEVSQTEWSNAKADALWLLDPNNTSDLELYETKLDEFRDLNINLLESSDYLTKICREEASRKRVIATIIQFSSIGLAFLIFLFMVYMMNRDFKQPLKEINHVFNSMGKGQFHLRLHRRQEDEFKDLFNGFNRFADSLQVIRNIEAQILKEDSIFEIMSYIKRAFKPFAAFDDMAVVYKNSSGTVSRLAIVNNELNETFDQELETFDDITELKDTLIVPVKINDAYIGHVSFRKSGGFDDVSIEFIKTLKQTLSFTFYKSLLFRDLLAIVTDGLADLAESRDPETRLHLVRMSSYAMIITKALKQNDKYKDQIDNEFISNIKLTAPMHDIGKVSVPDAILLKPGKLTDEEFDIMKTHAFEGSVVLRRIHERFTQYNLEYFDMAAEIALCHQEKFDGRGYPNGISGTDIPLAARISALADVFDALTSKRPYKDAFSLEKSYAIINESKGQHFDPDVVDAFFGAIDEIEAIHNKYKEE